jgi:hypothetical protein
MCILAIGSCPFGKVLLSSLAHFFIGSLVWGDLIFCSLYILIISPLSDVYLANIFSHPVGGLFSVEIISFVTRGFYFYKVSIAYAFS